MKHTLRSLERFTDGLRHAMALTALLLSAAGVLSAQMTGHASLVSASDDDKQTGQSSQEGLGAETLHVLVGRSLVINSPTRVKRLSIADPSIADALVINPTQILVNGKTPGGVSLVLWNEADQSQSLEVFVDLDILGLSQKIHEVFPQEAVRVDATKDVVVVSGHISSRQVADRILQIVSSATPKVVNMMDAPGAPATGEILLEVKFAEVDRSALSQFGVNLLSANPKFLGSTSTQQFAPPTLTQLPSTTAGTTSTTPTQAFTPSFTLSDLLNIFLFRPDIDVAATIKALQQQSVLQILAEPNLLAETDKEASFLAGGEFPFPVVQGGGAGTVPTVTIQFKEFGVRLNFTPQITEGNKIHLHVRPEVSALDFTNALTISGFFIPALSTRRVDAEMELEDGQSFAIAGLVDDRLTQVASKIPGLGDIPILGQLFRSRSMNKTKTELLVVVTPHIVHPVPAGQVPGSLTFPQPFLPPTVPEAKKPATPK